MGPEACGSAAFTYDADHMRALIAPIFSSKEGAEVTLLAMTSSPMRAGNRRPNPVII